MNLKENILLSFYFCSLILVRGIWCSLLIPHSLPLASCLLLQIHRWIKPCQSFFPFCTGSAGTAMNFLAVITGIGIFERYSYFFTYQTYFSFG